MTLQELDDILQKLGLDIQNNPIDMDARNKILALHGKSILETKRNKCNNCWLKENNKCGNICPIYFKSDNPIDISKEYLSKPNDIDAFPFLVLYMVPIYEETTGRKNFMKDMAKTFKEQWLKTHKDAKNFPDFG